MTIEISLDDSFRSELISLSKEHIKLSDNFDRLRNALIDPAAIQDQNAILAINAVERAIARLFITQRLVRNLPVDDTICRELDINTDDVAIRGESESILNLGSAFFSAYQALNPIIDKELGPEAELIMSTHLHDSLIMAHGMSMLVAEANHSNLPVIKQSPV